MRNLSCRLFGLNAGSFKLLYNKETATSQDLGPNRSFDPFFTQAFFIRYGYEKISFCETYFVLSFYIFGCAPPGAGTKADAQKPAGAAKAATLSQNAFRRR